MRVKGMEICKGTEYGWKMRKIYSTVTEHIFAAEESSNKRMTKLHKKAEKKFVKVVWENKRGTAKYENKPQQNCTIV